MILQKLMLFMLYFDEQTAPARETVQVACLPKMLT
jgi:hypothetical protein